MSDDIASSTITRALLGLRRLGGPDSGPTLDEAASHLRGRSTLLLMLLLGTVAMVPSPGVPVGFVFGGAILLLALGWMLPGGRGRLPGFLGRRRLPSGLLDGALRLIVPLLRRVERRLQPRLHGMVSGPGLWLAMLMAAVQGVLLALPIPMGNAVPGAAVALLALGILSRDGLCVLAGHLAGVAGGLVLLGLGWGLVWLGTALA